MVFHENQQIGYYTLVRFLGRGGFGEVWLAERRDVTSTEKVAIKLPHSSQIELQSIKDEIFNWILSGRHKNILPIIECETFGDQIAIVSEYAPDGSLGDLLKKRGCLRATEAIEIIVGILEGLAHLHQRRIIHRDLKPENILLQGATPRLTDFGIARALAEGSSTNLVMGTQAFMAPESFDGQRNVQTDIWSVGVILYLLLSGELPFPQKELTALVGAVVMHDPPPLSSDLPIELQGVVRRALAKNSADRYQSAEEMRTDLSLVLTGLSTSEQTAPLNFSTDPRSAAPTPAQIAAETEIITSPQKKKSKTGAIILALCALLASFFGLAVYGLYRVAQRVAVSQPFADGNSPSNTNTPVRITSGGDNPSAEKITRYSPEIVDEVFAAIEKEIGGKARVTRFIIYKKGDQVTHASVTVKDAANPDYYDSYTYFPDDQRLQKRALKSPAFFEKTGGKWFSKEDVNWSAVPDLTQKLSVKTAEIGEGEKDPMISITRKFISFQPTETYGDVIFELSISGERKDVELTADAKGENVQIKVD